MQKKIAESDYLNQNLAKELGLEPRQRHLECLVLPLHHSLMLLATGLPPMDDRIAEGRTTSSMFFLSAHSVSFNKYGN